MPSTACPNCGRVFQDSSSVLKHMNHRYSSCHLWFSRDPQQPSPPPPLEHPPSIYTKSHVFPGAGHIFHSGPGFLEWFHNDEGDGIRSSNPYHPFLSKGEWEIARFLSCSGLSMKLVDEFLSLSLVSFSQIFHCIVLIVLQIARLGLSFHCARTLRGRIELLPSGPAWKSTIVSMPGYESKDPLVFYYRDSMECVEFLLKNPLFSEEIEYQPRQDFDPTTGRRVYSEWITSDGAWDLQVCIFPSHPSYHSRVLIAECSRAGFHPTRPSLASPYHPTKRNSASCQEIALPTHYSLQLRTFIQQPGHQPPLTPSHYSHCSPSQTSSASRNPFMGFSRTGSFTRA